MKTKFLSLFAISALLFSACKSGDDDVIIPEANAELRIGSSLTPPKAGTRAYDQTWETSDAIGVYVINDGGSWATSTDVLYSNSQYAYDAAPSWSTSVTDGYQAFKCVETTARPVYPIGDTKVQLVGYYPYNSAWTDINTPIDLLVTTQTPQADIDFMYAPITTGTHQRSTAGQPVNLDFKHQLSKLIINVKAGSNITQTEVENATAELQGFIKAAKFNLTTATLTPTAATTTDFGNFAPFTGTAITGMDNRFEAILIPQNFTTNAGKVEFTIGTEKYVWDLSNLNTSTGMASLTGLEAGKKYTYTVTINGKGILVNGIVITDWVPGTEGEGVAE